jgi:hypothetical protein
MFVLFGNDNWACVVIFTIFLVHKIVSRKSRFNISNEIMEKFQKIVFSSERVIRCGRNRVRPVQDRKIEPLGWVFNYFGHISNRSWDIHEKLIQARIIVIWWAELHFLMFQDVVCYWSVDRVVNLCLLSHFIVSLFCLFFFPQPLNYLFREFLLTIFSLKLVFNFLICFLFHSISVGSLFTLRYWIYQQCLPCSP